jgi:hypothetical protein
LEAELLNAEPTEAAISAVEPELKTEEVTPPEGEEQKQEVDPVEKERRKMQRSIDRRTAALGVARHQIEQANFEKEQLRQELAALRDPDKQDEGVSEDKVQKLIAQKAREIAEFELSKQAISRSVEKMQSEGSKFENWDSMVNEVGDEIPFYHNDNPAKPTPFLEALKELDKPALVIKYLAENMEQAEGLAKASPTQLAIRLARLEATAIAQPTTSKTPAPISPVGGRAKSSTNPELMTQDEYEAYRKKNGAKWAK